jgi:hypothetical protein
MATMGRSSTEIGNTIFGAVFWVILLVFTGILAFNEDVGVPGALKAMNTTKENFHAYVDNVTTFTDANYQDLCDVNNLDKHNDCKKAAEEFKKQLEKLRFIDDEVREVIRSGHVWYHAFNTLGLDNVTTETEEKHTELMGYLDDLSDLHDTYNTVVTVQNALIGSFVLLLVYFVAMLVEGMNSGMFRGPGARSVMYWLTHAHVFIILLLSTYAFIVTYSNDYFMDQADAVCRTIVPASPTTIEVRSNGTVTQYTAGDLESYKYNTVCYNDMSTFSNSHFSLYFWIVVIFSQLYVSSHFNLRHGPIDDDVGHVFNSVSSLRLQTAGKVPSGAKVGKRVAYAPLTSIHRT